jgi:hypothetical protein
MIVADFLCNVIEVKIAGFRLTAALENGIIILAAFGVEDAPDPILLLETTDV